MRSSENIFKGKELVATNFGVGVDILKLNIEGATHSIEVSRCFPFLNKSNIAFNCNNAIEAKEAIRISHNLLAALLALPASKTKIVIRNHLNSQTLRQYTPLLREIYGGMVCTAE